jgi:signal transduction histidine kinase
MKAFLLVLIGFLPVLVFSQTNIPDQVRIEVDSILRLMEKVTDEDVQIDMLMSIYKTRIEGYPLLILEIGQKLAVLSQQMHAPIIEAASWGYLGQGYRLSGNYTKGLQCHYKAIAIAENTGNFTMQAICYNQLGHIYKDREEYDQALKIYRKAMTLSRQGNNNEARIWPMMNLGAILLSMNQLDSALYYSTTAFDRCNELKITRNLPYITGNIGGAYSRMGNNEKALEFYHKSLYYAGLTSSPRFQNLVYLGLAEHYLRNKMPDSSAYYAKEAIDVVQGTVFTFLNIKPAKLLMDIYETNNADSTLKYFRIYKTANDSLFSSRAVQELQMMTFEEDQRRLELDKQRIAYQNKIKMNVMLGGLGTFSLIALILYRNNKQKQKANKTLLVQKEELQEALSKLKSTQSQLIQAEKMASLGELTAGIAHEIQNPLNFVNNFSEVSSELLDEMKQELATGNKQQAIDIADDVKQNLDKIIYHGKRADGIVKGMLQHSRTGTGQKEPTDINALADEYLRLAYHGMRAKDKSFNVNIKTDFDESIGKIDVVPQDIGRVLLNLITNAFHALAAKATAIQTPSPLKGGDEFVPTVSITTKKLLPLPGGRGSEETNGFIEISVTDNGPGIPEAIKEKIFQPFFTTKPTGQGTGLGLSLSYDIVKAHGGELKVETKEGEGSVFVIQIPV